METTTSFDLNRAIGSWLANLEQSPAFRSENFYELETHLRDSIATLERQGLSVEEAFMVAAKRIGKGHSLETEFAKVNGRSLWLDRALWILIGIQAWGLVSGTLGTALRNAVTFGLINYDFAGHGRTIPGILFFVAQTIGFAASLAAGWWLVSRQSSRFQPWATKLLKRRPLWYLAVVGVTLLLLVSFGTSYGTTALQLKLIGLNQYGQIANAQAYSSALGWMLQTGALVVITLLIARKRLGGERVTN